MARSDSHWLRLWEQGDTPWHVDQPDSQLQTYISLLTKDDSSAAILVPFCGKSLDLIWLSEQGYSVTGVELSPLAVEQLFEENSIPHAKTEIGMFTVYKATDRHLKVLVGSLFNLTPEITGLQDAIWDCRSLGAVNIQDRTDFIRVLLSILKPSGNILISHLDYDPSERDGPPFSLTAAAIQMLFSTDGWIVERIASEDLSGTPVAVMHHLSWANQLLHLVHRNGH